ncbi:MAG: hypothetical protein H0X62_05850 [Bacteroidetes bacterium]|nr:hypothetical protein [Bacteroidota bacterium]
MKKIISVFLFFIFIYACGTPEEAEKEPTINFAEIHSLIEDGDIIVKRGKGAVSNLIAKNLKERVPLSHCGIIVFENDTLYIIHSVAKELSGRDGVQTISLEEFLDDSHIGSVFVSRVKLCKTNTISKFAKEQLEKRTPFDYEFDLKSKDAIYCTELVSDVLLKSQGQDMFKQKTINGKPVLTFNSLLDTTLFNIILIK